VTAVAAPVTAVVAPVTAVAAVVTAVAAPVTAVAAPVTAVAAVAASVAAVMLGLGRAGANVRDQAADQHAGPDQHPHQVTFHGLLSSKSFTSGRLTELG
jgi:hypothetical protein